MKGTFAAVWPCYSIRIAIWLSWPINNVLSKFALRFKNAQTDSISWARNECYTPEIENV